MKDELIISPVDPYAPEVKALLEQADQYLLSRYPADLCFLDDAAALAAPNVSLLGATLGASLVGIGAAKLLSEAEPYGEIKRLFVSEGARGRGVGKRLMQALEGRLQAQGMTLVRLETGVEQPEAVSLYKQLGYAIRGPYGDYPANELSIFMERQLGRQ